MKAVMTVVGLGFMIYVLYILYMISYTGTNPFQ